MAADPPTHEQLLAEADLALRLDDVERAAELFERVLQTAESASGRAGALAGLGQLAFRRGDPRGALAALERARFRIEEARALAYLGESEEAAAVAMAICPILAESEPHDAARGYVVIADAFREGGDAARALELYELGLELLESAPNPWLADAYARTAELLEAEGRKDEALRMLKRAVNARTAAQRWQQPPE